MGVFYTIIVILAMGTPGMTLCRSCAMRRAFRNTAAEIGRKLSILGQP
jgi:hypothetical protein